MTDDNESRIEELEAWQSAVKNQLAYLRQENEELQNRVAELEALVDPDPGATEYDQLTKDQKVHRIRTTLVETAARTNGGDAMKYKAVMTLFNGHPSPGHCYDLMERAAQLDGFHYDTAGSGKGEKRVRVNLDAVNDETLIHAANNATAEGAA